MEFVKRHAFLLGLAAGVVIIGAGFALFVHLGYRVPNRRLERKLAEALREAKMLREGKLYNDELVEKLDGRVQQTRDVYRRLLAEIRRMGAAREPLLKGVFPYTANTDLLHGFKARYDEKLAEFMETLGAVNPRPSQDMTPEQMEELDARIEKAAMFANLRYSFWRPDWVGQPQAPTLAQVRDGQEDIWLMSDLVRIIAGLNREAAGRDGAPTVEEAAVKELVEIRIGADKAAIEGLGMTTGRGRYLGVTGRRAGTAAEERAPTLTGRASDPGFYLVLPWRLIVVADSNLAGELVRRLKGTESFLNVGAWRLRPVTKPSMDDYRDLIAGKRERYGREGVVRLEIVGESLVFQLQDGRVTTREGIAVETAPAVEGAFEEDI